MREHIDTYKQRLNESNKKYCWVIKNSEGKIQWVQKTMNYEKDKDLRIIFGYKVERHILLD